MVSWLNSICDITLLYPFSALSLRFCAWWKAVSQLENLIIHGSHTDSLSLQFAILPCGLRTDQWWENIEDSRPPKLLAEFSAWDPLGVLPEALGRFRSWDIPSYNSTHSARKNSSLGNPRMSRYLGFMDEIHKSVPRGTPCQKRAQAYWLYRGWGSVAIDFSWRALPNFGTSVYV